MIQSGDPRTAYEMIDRTRSMLSSDPKLKEDDGFKFALSNKLEKTPEFSFLLLGFAELGGGCAQSSSGFAGRWVVDRLLSGDSPGRIIERIEEFKKYNSYTAMDIRALRGVRVTRRHDLTDRAYLCPNSDLPDDWHRKYAFADYSGGWIAPSQEAALVQIFEVNPALHGSFDEVSRKPPTQSASFKEGVRLNAFAERVRIAVGLATDSAVELPFGYVIQDRECIIAHHGSFGMTTKPHMVIYVPEIEIDSDISYIKDTINNLENMNNGNALELGVDRLLRSRIPKLLEDRIIDLGMAAEIMLMHDPNGSGGDGKSEITNKISTRAALIVGGDAERRLSMAKTISALYSARSTTVHSGYAKQSLDKSIPEFDRAVKEVALALLSRGKFPDWKRLAVGAAE